MLAKDLINSEVVPLSLGETAFSALSWMDEYKVAHMPLIDGSRYIGIVSETEILNLSNINEELCNLSNRLSRPRVRDNDHVFVVLREMSNHQLTVMPVVDEEDNFKGLIYAAHLIHQFSQISAIQNPGGIIVLELNVKDYSMSEIAQIVESNNARILSQYITSHPDSMRMEVTIKLNIMDLTAVIQTFYRYNYQVTAFFSQEDPHEHLQDRYDALMTYLNI